MICCSLFSGMSTSPEPRKRFHVVTRFHVVRRFDVITRLDVNARLHVNRAQRGHI